MFPTKIKSMNWINVKDKHFAELSYKKDSGYSWESDLIDIPFMVAVELKSGWCIQQVILNESGLHCWVDGETEPFGWDVTDVTHWCLINSPKE